MLNLTLRIVETTNRVNGGIATHHSAGLVPITNPVSHLTCLLIKDNFTELLQTFAYFWNKQINNDKHRLNVCRSLI